MKKQVKKVATAFFPVIPVTQSKSFTRYSESRLQIGKKLNNEMEWVLIAKLIWAHFAFAAVSLPTAHVYGSGF